MQPIVRVRDLLRFDQPLDLVVDRFAVSPRLVTQFLFRLRGIKVVVAGEVVEEAKKRLRGEQE